MGTNRNQKYMKYLGNNDWHLRFMWWIGDGIKYHTYQKEKYLEHIHIWTRWSATLYQKDRQNETILSSFIRHMYLIRWSRSIQTAFSNPGFRTWRIFVAFSVLIWVRIICKISGTLVMYRYETFLWYSALKAQLCMK